jgi:hypothetical protein
MFGQPPMRDIKALRDSKVVAIHAGWQEQTPESAGLCGRQTGLMAE